MREILFRGKRMDNGEWIEGYYFQKPNPLTKNGEPIKHCISDLPPFGAEIIPETVGQYTGLKDRVGRRIFEGDVILSHYANVPIGKREQVEKVVFHNGRFSGMYSKNGGTMWAGLPSDFRHLPQDKTVYMEWCEIIGNINDNPELLKEE